MTYWIIPSNQNNFDVIGAFSKYEEIYWKQSSKIKVGDFVLIYISKPIQKIKYLCKAIEVDLKENPQPLLEFTKDGTPFLKYHKFMKIKMIKEIEDLDLVTLHDLGINGSFQSQIRANENLINHVKNQYSNFYKEDIEEANKPRISNTTQWVKVLENEYKQYQSGNSSFYLEILKIISNHIKCASAIDLANFLNLDYSGLNIKFEEFGKRIIKLLKLNEQTIEDGENRYWNFAFTGKHLKEGLFEYTLRNELYEAYSTFMEGKIRPNSEFERQFSEKFVSDDEFHEVMNRIIKNYKELEKLRQEFVKTFDLDKLKKLKIEEYALGRMETHKILNSQTFCYQLEITLKELGNMQGANSSKFGIYYEKKSGKIKINNSLSDDEDEAIKIMRNRIIDLINAGEKSDYNTITDINISPIFKGKILSTYFPDKFLSIFNEIHVDKLINFVGLTYNPKIINNLEQKKNLIVEKFIKKHHYFKDKPLHYFVAFIYDPIFKNSFLSQEYESIQVDPNETEEKLFDYLGKKEVISKDIKNSYYKPDYLKAQLSKMKAGSIAEEHVVDHEIRKLKKAGLEHLANKVIRVSNQDDSLGYDIESYDVKTKQKIFIEVKSKKYFNDDLSFYITKNELNYWDSLDHKLYYVFYKNNKAKIHIIEKSKIKKEDFESVLLRIDLKVKIK